MIIVSQDKNVIINFDNITTIGSGTDYGTKKKIIICVNTLGGEHFSIGQYDTEERAKEVLQEIVNRYKNWENMKVRQPSGVCLPVYEMPED